MERWDKITMQQVSNLIEKNKEFADKLQLRMAFGITNKKFFGAIYNNDLQIFYNTYEGQHTHILVAMVHIDFSEHLKKVDIARKRAESVRIQAELQAQREQAAEEAWQAELEKRKAKFEK